MAKHIIWKKKPKGAKQALNNEQNTYPFEEEPVADKKAAEEEQAAEQTAEQNAEQTAQGEEHEATAAEWEAALREAVAKRDEYLALAQRTQADFSNFRRRNATVSTDSYDRGVRETLTAFLPVLDNLERALNSANAGDGSGLSEGVNMILKQFRDVGTKLGLEEVPAASGDPFDPEMHNAVMRGEEGEPGTVIECFEKGYRVKDRIIRYASVKVHAE